MQDLKGNIKRIMFIVQQMIGWHWFQLYNNKKKIKIIDNKILGHYNLW